MSWDEFIDLKMVLDGRKDPSEPPWKVSLTLIHQNRVWRFHQPLPQVSPWSLGGHVNCWWTWSWCQIWVYVHLKLLWKFYQDPTCFVWFRECIKFWPGWLLLGDICKEVASAMTHWNSPTIYLSPDKHWAILLKMYNVSIGMKRNNFLLTSQLLRQYLFIYF